jgi:3-oxoadipate enol-lactonase
MLVSIGGRNIYFDLVGQAGAPVIYLAHPLAADSGVWAEQVPALLAAGFRVLRVDMRGHGGSEATPGPYSMEELAQDAVNVLNHHGIDKAHFCGLSIGGMIAQGVAILHPARVASLVLCDTRSAAPADAAKRWGPRIKEAEACGSMAPLAAGTMERWLSPKGREANPLLWRQIRDTVAATSVIGYVGCVGAISSFDWIPRLAEISARTLVICGSDDAGSDPDENRKIAARVQRGAFVAIEGARHLPNVEDPEIFNEVLVDWCARRP